MMKNKKNKNKATEIDKASQNSDDPEVLETENEGENKNDPVSDNKGTILEALKEMLKKIIDSLLKT